MDPRVVDMGGTFLSAGVKRPNPDTARDTDGEPPTKRCQHTLRQVVENLSATLPRGFSMWLRAYVVFVEALIAGQPISFNEAIIRNEHGKRIVENNDGIVCAFIPKMVYPFYPFRMLAASMSVDEVFVPRIADLFARHEQHSASWSAFRELFFTGSLAPRFDGYDYDGNGIEAIFNTVVHNIPQTPPNEIGKIRMDAGTVMEPYIARMYLFYIQNPGEFRAHPPNPILGHNGLLHQHSPLYDEAQVWTLEETGLRPAPMFPWIAASPDRWVNHGDGTGHILEIKYKSSFLRKDAKTWRGHIAQVMLEMVAYRDWYNLPLNALLYTDLAMFYSPNQKLIEYADEHPRELRPLNDFARTNTSFVVYRIYYDDNYAKELISRITEFVGNANAQGTFSGPSKYNKIPFPEDRVVKTVYQFNSHIDWSTKMEKIAPDLVGDDDDL